MPETAERRGKMASVLIVITGANVWTMNEEPVND
jgi:hypothetical protein